MVTSLSVYKDCSEDIKSELITQDYYKGKAKDASKLYGIKIDLSPEGQDRKITVTRQEETLASCKFVWQQQQWEGMQLLTEIIKTVYGY